VKEKYADCRMVEGHVQVAFIPTSSEYANLSSIITFPELREITDYLIVYQVEQVVTLKHMIPNLAVIRGKHLFSNYALVIYQVSYLLIGTSHFFFLFLIDYIAFIFFISAYYIIFVD
jgi:hypothetical protein